MNSNWLEIPGEDIVNVQEIMQQIRQRIAVREGNVPYEEAGDPTKMVDTLWEEVIGDRMALSLPGLRACDIVPRGYVIEWRVPILGPIHAIVRRIINAEIRRYLLPSLEKQSTFNREMRHLLKDLIRENTRLRQEVEELRQRLEQGH